jgi:hypothetical protein
MDDVESDLAKLSLDDRIKVVVDDIKSRADLYRAVPAHTIAHLLGIDDSDRPGQGWNFTRYVRRETLVDYLNRHACGSGILDWLEDKVDQHRVPTIDKLRDELDEKGTIDLALLPEDEVHHEFRGSRVLHNET